MSSPEDSHRRYLHEPNVYAQAEQYYSAHADAARRKDGRVRTFSARLDPTPAARNRHDADHRRYSIDQFSGSAGGRKFLIPVEQTLRQLLEREDTDHNSQITIEDAGPKFLKVGTAASEGYRHTDIRGTYNLSNLLQELTLAKDYGRTNIVLEEQRLNENPVDRLSRYIKDEFWRNLTRRIDGNNIGAVARDPKDWTSDPRPRIYIPHGAPEQYEYYTRIAKDHPELRLDVQWLARDITPEYIRDLNNTPGLLAVAMEISYKDGKRVMRGKPFIVPGGRFNEFYGWDSYMASLGLLIHDKVAICKSMVENFCFCIQHYGKILNANRTYYLGRSQPPFLTDMTLRVFDRIRHEPGSQEFLRNGILAAIKEYYTVWMAEPRYDPATGLSRYRPVGIGVPPETEATHFHHVLTPYAEKHNMSFAEFVDAYNHRRILEPELDHYFLHDRAVRESGHDTSYRLEKVAADLATVDLNSCLYKYECDISRSIGAYFNNALAMPLEFCAGSMKAGQIETTAAWERRARRRRLAMDKYMWSEERGLYVDYNTETKQKTNYESATTYWALWAGISTPVQAAALIIRALPRFEMFGGLVSGTLESRGDVGLHRPNRQWDYPFGWAPHQILAWIGMERYGYAEDASRLAYRWLYMVTKAFVDFNGIVVEKYDLTRPKDPQRVEAEYGNQGADFKGVPREGYIVGLTMIDTQMRRALGAMTTYKDFHRATANSEEYHATKKKQHPLDGSMSGSHGSAADQPTGFKHEGTGQQVEPLTRSSSVPSLTRSLSAGRKP